MEPSLIAQELDATCVVVMAWILTAAALTTWYLLRSGADGP